MPGEIPAVIPGAPPVVKSEGLDPTLPTLPTLPAEKITMTQAELDARLLSDGDKRVSQALETSRAKWDVDHKAALVHEREEAERLALMSVKEREKELEKQRESRITERENVLNRRETQLGVIKTLDENKLPVSFSEMLLGDTAAQTAVNIETFKKSWKAAIDAEVTLRIKGVTPEGGTTPTGAVDMNAIIRKVAGR